MEERELTDQEKAQGYIETKWKEHTNYECVHSYFNAREGESAPVRCAYTTLWEGKMKDHIARGNHPWGRPDGPFIPREPSVAQPAEKLSEY